MTETKKLLALRICEHDSNFSYWDGNTLHYYKSERKKGVKHHGYSNLWEWEEEIQDLWGINYTDLDDICIVLDEWIYYNHPESYDSFFPVKPVKLPRKSLQGFDRINHHYAHVLSNWPICKQSDVDFVIDGFGEFDITWTVIKDNQLIATGSRDQQGSIGQLMAITGKDIFGIDNGHGLDVAGKLMGLQSYGRYNEDFAKIIKEYSIDESSIVFNFDLWIEYCQDINIAHLTKLDWIHTVHEIVGDMLVNFFKNYAKSDDVITYSGGVAQNVIWNTKLKREFKNLIIPPHCGDDGLSLGGIEWLRRKHNLNEFKLNNFPYIQSDQNPNPVSTETIKEAARLLASGKIIGWYQDHGEIGPRALGNRSILCNPRIHDAKTLVNRVKNRENYRPFGASVLKDHASGFFKDAFESPYMLYVFESLDYSLSSITHTDGTCRIQTVDESNNTYYALLKEFYNLTGCPVLLNTSLNVAGKGIAGTRSEALEILYTTPLDVLFYGDEKIIDDQ